MQGQNTVLPIARLPRWHQPEFRRWPSVFLNNCQAGEAVVLVGYRHNRLAWPKAALLQRELKAMAG